MMAYYDVFRRNRTEYPDTKHQAAIFVSNSMHHLANSRGGWSDDAITALIEAHVRINDDKAKEVA
jgi:hypothetical protein